ncbi:shikimate dehydrogenase [Natranaerobius thermophilus]|nr:shikimate dehydrogenase [Natranaerobius thermophilus]
MVKNPKGLLALIGNPVGHSLSPVMHNAAFHEMGLNWCYHAFNVESIQLAEAIHGLKALNFNGGNVTSPYKEQVIPYLDNLTWEAKIAGAVNTLILDDLEGSITGDNTDGDGFVTYLEKEKNFTLKNKDICVIGAGGAARAICMGMLKRAPNSIVIVNRNLNRADKLVERLNQAITEDQFKKLYGHVKTHLKAVSLEPSCLIGVLKESNLIINSIPTDPPEYIVQSLQTLETIDTRTAVVDLRYGEQLGPYLQQIARPGIEISDGSGMLLYQGILSFEKWTGEEAPVKIMKKALNW